MIIVKKINKIIIFLTFLLISCQIKVVTLSKKDSMGILCVNHLEQTLWNSKKFIDLQSSMVFPTKDEKSCQGNEAPFYIVKKDRFYIFGETKISYLGSIGDYHLIKYFKKYYENKEQIFDFAVSKDECNLPNGNAIYTEFKNYSACYRRFWVKDGQCFLEDRKPISRQ